MSEVAEHKGAGESRSWRVRGMDCPSCVAKIERAVSRVAGVQEVSINLMAETLTARVGSDGHAATIVRIVESLGYKLLPRPAPAAVPRQEHQPGCGHDHDRAQAEEPGRDHSAGKNLRAHGDDDEESSVPWWRSGKAKLVWLLGSLVVTAWLGSRLFAAEAHWIFVAATLVAIFPFPRSVRGCSRRRHSSAPSRGKTSPSSGRIPGTASSRPT